MTNRYFNLFKKVLSAGVCLSFFIVNGPMVYSNEANFWSSRRAASDQMRRNGAGVGNAGSTDGQMLLAQLPKAGPLEFGRAVSASAIDQEAQAPKEPFSIGPKTGDWLGKLVLPYGSVREVYLSPDTKAPFIVHIQDAHGIEEAQRNISSMIGQLAQEPGISLVGLEGASGSFSLKPYRDYPDASITKDIADLFLKKGLIAGPEYAGLTLPKSPDFFGAEDQSLYTANVKALKDAYKGKQAAQETLAGLQRAAEKLKEVSFSEDLKTFDRHFNNYHSDKEKLAPYARYILETHQTLQNLRFDTKKNPPSPRPSPAVPTRHFLLAQSRAGEGENFRPEQLGLLVLALDEEESLDFARVELERKQLVERLVGKLSAGQIQDLVAKSVDYRAGRMGYGDYHHQLKKLCVAHGIKFSEWPQLNRYLSYVLLADKIDRNELLNEMEALDRSIPERLARNENERQLVAVAFDLSLLAKLLRHEMSVADWTAYEGRMGEIHRLAARLTALDSSVKVKGLTAETLKPYEDFCSYASRRNNALTDNLLRQMADTKGKSAVLVAGGFHTEGLSALLRKKQVSYVVVTPKISAIPKDNDYLDVMANDPLPLEKQLAGDRIYLAKAIEMANPEGMSARTIAGLQKVAQLGQKFVDIGRSYALTTDSQYKGATVVFHLNSTTPVYLVTNYKGEGSLSNLVTATRHWIVDISKRVMGEDSTRVEDALLASTAIASVALASTGLPVVGAALFAFSHVWKNIAHDLKIPQQTANTPWAAFKTKPVAAVAYTTILFGAAFALLHLAMFVLGVSIPVSVDSTLAPFMVSEGTQSLAQILSLQNILTAFFSVSWVHKAYNKWVGGRRFLSFVFPHLTFSNLLNQGETSEVHRWLNLKNTLPSFSRLGICKSYCIDSLSILQQQFPDESFEIRNVNNFHYHIRANKTLIIDPTIGQFFNIPEESREVFVGTESELVEYIRKREVEVGFRPGGLFETIQSPEEISKELYTKASLWSPSLPLQQREELPHSGLIDITNIRSMVSTVVNAYQNGHIEAYSRILKNGQTIKDLRMALAKIAESEIQRRIEGVGFKLDPLLKGKYMEVYTSTLLPGFIIKIPKEVDPSGNPINFENDILPGYLIAKENLGGLFGVMVMENIPVSLDGNVKTIPHAIVQEKVTPISKILKELKEQENDYQSAGKMKELDTVHLMQETIKTKLDNLFEEMWRRGIMDSDFYNIVNNYGVTPTGEFVGIDVDGIMKIEDHLRIEPKAMTERARERRDRILSAWENGKNSGAEGKRVPDIFDYHVRAAQEEWLNSNINEFFKIQSQRTSLGPKNESHWTTLNFLSLNQFVMSGLLWVGGGTWGDTWGRAGVMVKSNRFSMFGAPLTELPFLPGAAVWGGISSVGGYLGFRPSLPCYITLALPKKLGIELTKLRG
jgi:hypothetical protein